MTSAATPSAPPATRQVSPLWIVASVVGYIGTAARLTRRRPRPQRVCPLWADQLAAAASVCRGARLPSVDGTYLAHGPDRNLPRLLSWPAELDKPPHEPEGALR